jgi:FtsP/CotA-like multicopper oxidase with cupredoxin domain
MKLEQVLPMLRNGETITRTRLWNGSSRVVYFVKIMDEQLKFKFIARDGTTTSWHMYSMREQDILAEDWEIAG